MNSGRIQMALTRLAMFACMGAGAAAEVNGQAVPLSELSTEELGRPISVFFDEAPIREVLFTFAEFADRSIVPGTGLDRLVSAEIRDQPWNVALDALLGAYGLVAYEQESGIILVQDMRRAFEREAVLPIVTEALTVRYGDALELQDLIAAILSDRGRVSVSTASNALVVSDIPRVVESARRLVSDLDVRARQVDIAAKIIFVNRSGLAGFGITYDLKDTRGNQLNLLVPGIVDADGDGVISAGERQTEAGTDVVSLGGNSLAALGNATNRVANPTLSLLTSLVIGRSTLVGFIDALEAAQLTDVEAQPSVRVIDNRTARIVVGEETPVRVIDAGAQLQANGAAGTRSTVPVATVDYKETGVILEVTPRITDADEIMLDLAAERSSADLAPSDVGLIFRRQKAESRVLVRDGETVVIGGLTVDETGEVRSGIPLLMDLPLVGRLFRTRRESTTRRDLLILVTPTIVRAASP
ncbi:MAG: hypothetical protein OXH51_01025 [Gemmatimonadetes bacterium]|nr:hypothetical protein [Gemmatimonadota bacterium]MCY3610091.1 hypothetical protein [Gemmatimonadota bacterium]MCY3676064.1 hypothetical protein [Gemmatimonadota bacterium]MYA42249.1 hypothetical protein [Gemmatimonadota bacterium]MYE94119.1 hypothetical protein [Gemmatimonadota bacterium]